jgi:hypothetical protein
VKDGRVGVVASKVTTLSSALLAGGFAVAGLVLLFVSGLDRLPLPVAAFLGQLGGLLAATGLITIAWDLVGRRAFAQEVLAKAQLSAEVTESGLTRVTDQYLELVQWDALFRDVHHLDIVVAYASTWRNSHRSRLDLVAGDPSKTVRVFLPDPRDEMTVRVLADRFSMAPDVLRTRIDEAIADFRSLHRPGGARVEVFVRKGDAVFSCYRFDSQAVLTLYSHSRERRTSVPTLVMAGGSLSKFVRSEIDAIAEQSEPAP